MKLRIREFSGSRRAAFDLQFNWIFVLIVGGMIIMFFYMAINRHQSVAEVAIDVEVRAKLQTILTSGQASTATTYSITVPNNVLGFGCDGFSLGDIRPIKFDHAFAPTLLKSQNDRLVVTSYPFNWPFKVDNFLYVTSPEIRYIFFNDTTAFGADHKLESGIYLNWLMNDSEAPSLPDDITKEIIAIDKIGCQNLKDESNYQVIFVFNNLRDALGLTDEQKKCAQSTFDRMDPKDVKAVEFRVEDEGLEGRGSVKFYDLDEATGLFRETHTDRLPYVGREALLGAIISGDQEIFRCAMEEAVERLHVVSYTYLKKSMIMKEHATPGIHPIDDFDESCAGRFFIAEVSLDNLYRSSETGYPASDMRQIYAKIKEVENRNRLLSLKSCPLIY